jgi:cytochrome b561
MADTVSSRAGAVSRPWAMLGRLARASARTCTRLGRNPPPGPPSQKSFSFFSFSSFSHLVIYVLIFYVPKIIQTLSKVT